MNKTKLYHSRYANAASKMYVTLGAVLVKKAAR